MAINNAAWYNFPAGNTVQSNAPYTSGGVTTQPTVYATSNTGIPVMPRVMVDGHTWLYDIPRAIYYLETDNSVRLTHEQVIQIQNGTALLDWKDMRIRYVDRNTGESSGYYADSIVSGNRMHVFPDYPNLDKLDMLVEEVCQRGRLAA